MRRERAARASAPCGLSSGWAAGFAGPGEEGKAGPAWEKGWAGVWAGLGWFQGVGMFSFYFSFSISNSN